MLEQQKARSSHLSRLSRIFIQVAEVFTLHASAELTSFDQGSIHSFYVNQPVDWRAGKAFMLPAQTQKALAPLCNRSGKLEAVAKRVSVVDENGVVPGDLRPATVAHKLDPDDVAELIAAQIEANKLVQYGLIAQWHAAGKAPDTPRPDLTRQIRPQLDELQNRLLQQYAAFAPYRTDPNCQDWLAKARSDLIKNALHGQALIRATGELCITDQ